MELGLMNPVLAERLRISKEGQLWPPFAEDNWWVIIRHERHLPAQLDHNMRLRLINEMYESWMRQEVTKSLKEFNDFISSSSPNQPSLDAINPSPSPKNAETEAGSILNSSKQNKSNLFKSLFRLD